MAAACFVSNFLYNGDMFVESEYLGKGLISGAIAIVFLVTSGVTGYSVLHMRKTIKGLKNIYVKETLILIHLVNFIVYGVFYCSYLSLVVAAWRLQPEFE